MTITFEFFIFLEGPTPYKAIRQEETLTIQGTVPQIGSTLKFELAENKFGNSKIFDLTNSSTWAVRDVTTNYVVGSETEEYSLVTLYQQSN